MPTYTMEDLFLGAWEGPLNPAYLNECSACGAAVADMSKHTEWHNTLP